MTYLYYRSTTSTSQPQISEKSISEWKHLADKKNWRITQLPNGYYQTEVNQPEAVDTSVEHFTKKLEYIKGPKVVKTFE